MVKFGTGDCCLLVL